MYTVHCDCCTQCSRTYSYTVLYSMYMIVHLNLNVHQIFLQLTLLAGGASRHENRTNSSGSNNSSINNNNNNNSDVSPSALSSPSSVSQHCTRLPGQTPTNAPAASGALAAGLAAAASAATLTSSSLDRLSQIVERISSATGAPSAPGGILLSGAANGLHS